MSLSDDFKTVWDAIDDRNSLKKFTKEITKSNEKDRRQQEELNSYIYELMNVINAIMHDAESSGVELNRVQISGFPNFMKGTEKDIRVIMKAASLNRDFNNVFSVHETTGNDGKQAWIIQRK